MSEEYDDGIERTPAESNPWHEFLLESRKLDGKKYPKGWHWFWGIYELHKDKPEFLRINLKEIQKKLHHDHWLNQLNRRNESGVDDTPSKDRAASVLRKNLEGHGHSETPYKIIFSGLTFEPDEAIFSELVFPLKTFFEYSKFSGDAEFINTSFCENADFRNAIFFGNPDFKNTNFLTTAIFDKVKFQGRALFLNTNFSGYATFKDAKFINVAFFSNATFSHPAFFNKAKFSEYVDFKDVTFLYPVEFYETTFSTEALFNGAKFSKAAIFNKTIFSKSADFTDAIFSQIAEFRSAIFSDKAYFNNTTFRGHTNFITAHFKERPPHFYNAKLSADITWRNAKWPRMNRKTNLDLIDQNQNAYENLTYHMKTLEKYHDTHSFFRQEMRCRRKLGSVFNSLLYGFYEYFADYGYGVERALIAWFLHIVLGMIVIMSTISYGEIGLKESLFCSASASVANANPYVFLVINDGSLMDCYIKLHWFSPMVFSALRGFQAIAGIPLLFLVLLTLRIRFRLK